MRQARGVSVLLWLLVSLVGCAPAAPVETTGGSGSLSDIVFLTRDGCVNTGTMRARLDEALARLGWPSDYAVIDADTLTPSDRRGAYGTPTVLHAGRDLFGMPEPSAPHASPT